ncbi:MULTISPECIES: DICT sensory domain-containing protein [unclassified Halorhabdus]|uniref:DICT sensory domain-containing protein n=1 Tax=unclassified Halorhabdus TaxID=2621901 RepID=UPI0023DAA968|nr:MULTISPECIES: DICT sensory domain-containing protein [unclassified Halorhabdus]WEL18691.1 Putative sensor protein, containd DICT domain [Halorhabdus sp. SVX81]WEL22616.1 Putative sensor protein, containd DICT domain [Halorhabdus sp. BNX81]
MGISSFIDAVEDREKTVTVLNRESVDPLYRMLEGMFEDDSVSITESQDPEAPGDVVLLRDQQSGSLAISQLGEISETLLLVNSDLYVTGTVPLEDVETPEVVAHLSDVTFTVADKQKFLLIHISRHIESLALETDGGVLHSSFQRLSRLRDERGTAAAYETLATSAVETHVYGVDDWDPPAFADELTVHAGDTPELRDSWFVVHDGDGDEDRMAALVAEEVGPNEYRGYWTFEPGLVKEILGYLESTY